MAPGFQVKRALSMGSVGALGRARMAVAGLRPKPLVMLASRPMRGFTAMLAPALRIGTREYTRSASKALVPGPKGSSAEAKSCTWLPRR